MDAKQLEKYKDDLDMPMECLAVELYGVLGDRQLGDPEIVEHAIKKIRMLKKMMLATGFSESMLQACMEE